MTDRPSGSHHFASQEQIAHLRHELLTPINHVLGLTEIQMDEASETGLSDYVPALAEINTRGQKLLSIIQGELTPFSRPSDLKKLDARLESEARPGLGEARKLAEHLQAAGHHSAAEDLNLVSSALENLLAISWKSAQDLIDHESAEPIRK